MSGWRAALVAAVVGGLILAAGYLIPRISDRSPTAPSTTVTAGEAPPLACSPGLEAACRALAPSLGSEVRTFRPGSDPGEGVVVVAPAADLPAGLEPGPVVARSPVAIAAWLERADILRARCGVVDLACLAGAYGRSWEELGGLDSWGDFKIGLADATATESGLQAWRVVAEDGVPAALAASLRLRSADPGSLMTDLLLFGASRADAVVTTEVAIAAQLPNAPGRGGVLVVSYPDPTAWVEYVAAGRGRGTEDLIARLAEPEIRALMGPVGLRPPAGDPIGLADGLGTPGQPLPPADDSTRATLVGAWNDL